MSDFQSPTPEQSPGFQFWKLHSRWQKKIVAALSPYGISHTQFVILASIRWFQEQSLQPSQKQLCDVTGIEKMTLSKAIRKLEKSALVMRSENKSDSRSFCVVLTAQGSGVIPHAIQAIESVDSELFGSLGQKKAAALTALLVKLNQQLDQPPS